MQNARTQKIRPFLCFNGRAEEAANFYTSVFKNSSIDHVSRYDDEGPGPAGQAMVVTFELDGVQFMALNGCSEITFNSSISFIVDCATQDEVDYYWSKLSEGGETNQCGWLRDKFGVSWQIVPTRLGELLTDEDDEKSGRVIQAMLKMEKIDVAELERAYAGKKMTLRSVAGRRRRRQARERHAGAVWYEPAGGLLCELLSPSSSTIDLGPQTGDLRSVNSSVLDPFRRPS
jgi:predicted 3-demethylubiquinone-9 3-methyltransferase (glyoxalase superfamily)